VKKITNEEDFIDIGSLIKLWYQRAQKLDKSKESKQENKKS
jgi:hypothetical protein